MLAIGHGQECLEPSKHAVGAPVLGELDRRARQVPAVLLQLRLEAGEEGEGVRGRSREPRHHAVLVELSHLPGARLDDGRADGDLTVSGDRHLGVVTDRDDRRGMN